MTLVDSIQGMKARKEARKKREREKARKEIERRKKAAARRKAGKAPTGSVCLQSKDAAKNLKKKAGYTRKTRLAYRQYGGLLKRQQVLSFRARAQGFHVARVGHIDRGQAQRTLERCSYVNDGCYGVWMLVGELSELSEFGVHTPDTPPSLPTRVRAKAEA